MADYARGEIWWVRFDPVIGDEIQKTRPGVVISRRNEGSLRLLVVVPVTSWRSAFARHRSKVRIAPSGQNGLTGVSAADVMQMRSISAERLASRIGVLEDPLMEDILTALRFVVE